jgi:hypothetical protein
VAEATRGSRAEQSSWSDDNEEQLVREKEKEKDKARPVRAQGRERCGNGSGRGDKTIEGELTKAVKRVQYLPQRPGKLFRFCWLVPAMASCPKQLD